MKTIVARITKQDARGMSISGELTVTLSGSTSHQQSWLRLKNTLRHQGCSIEEREPEDGK